MEDLQLDNHEVCNDVHHEHHEGSEKKITGTQNKILEGDVFHVTTGVIRPVTRHQLPS